MGESKHRSFQRSRICLIGAGNVATHLASALNRVANIAQICSRTSESAKILSENIGGSAGYGTLDQLIPDADFYIIAANDDSIVSIAQSTPPFPGIWAHTSGSVPISVFQGLKERYGSFYPLQTFSKSIAVDVSRVPMFIEGSDEYTCDHLLDLAKSISTIVDTADSERRKALHLAAVFACNFANLMWLDADNLMQKEGLTINYLMPLLEVTLQKVLSATPQEAMTGPARRGDIAVLRAQLSALPSELQETYSLLSKRILNIYHPELDSL